MIFFMDNLLGPEELQKANQYLNTANWNYGWKSNDKLGFGHWNTDITHTSPTNPIDVSDRLPDVMAGFWEKINTAFFQDKAILTRCYANRHTYGVEGYIHTDTKRDEDYTVVIYMNEIWNMNWGGETSFYNLDRHEIIQSYMPMYGRVLVFKGNVPHCARSVTRICPEARTTLMFKASVNPSVMYTSESLLMEFLQNIGTQQLPHKNGSLYDHLMRTYHILKHKASDEVAVAGGLHSVYGTNVYKNQTLSKDSDIVESIFGKRIDHLVRLFSSINRPHCLEKPDGSLSKKDLYDLRTIECANLYDQNELQNFPNLRTFAKNRKNDN